MPVNIARFCDEKTTYGRLCRTPDVPVLDSSVGFPPRLQNYSDAVQVIMHAAQLCTGLITPSAVRCCTSQCCNGVYGSGIRCYAWNPRTQFQANPPNPIAFSPAKRKPPKPVLSLNLWCTGALPMLTPTFGVDECKTHNSFFFFKHNDQRHPEPPSLRGGH